MARSEMRSLLPIDELKRREEDQSSAVSKKHSEYNTASFTARSSIGPVLRSNQRKSFAPVLRPARNWGRHIQILEASFSALSTRSFCKYRIIEFLQYVAPKKKGRKRKKREFSQLQAQQAERVEAGAARREVGAAATEAPHRLKNVFRQPFSFIIMQTITF